MSTTTTSAIQFYAATQERYLRERGPIGKSAATGRLLPRMFLHDCMAVPAMLVPFLVKSLAELQYTGDDKRYAAWVFSVTQEQASEAFKDGNRNPILASADPLAQRLERPDTFASDLYARSMFDFLRLGKRTVDPIVRKLGVFPYHYWPRHDGAAARARVILKAWDNLMDTITSIGNVGLAPGQPYFGLVQTEAFWAAIYKVVTEANNTIAIEVTWTATIEAKAREVAKEGATVLKDVAGEIGEMAGDAADVVGEALGKAGSGFLRGVGLWGAALVIGLVYAKKAGWL